MTESENKFRPESAGVAGSKQTFIDAIKSGDAIRASDALAELDTLLTGRRPNEKEAISNRQELADLIQQVATGKKSGLKIYLADLGMSRLNIYAEEDGSVELEIGMASTDEVKKRWSGEVEGAKSGPKQQLIDAIKAGDEQTALNALIELESSLVEGANVSQNLELPKLIQEYMSGKSADMTVNLVDSKGAKSRLRIYADADGKVEMHLGLGSSEIIKKKWSEL